MWKLYVKQGANIQNIFLKTFTTQQLKDKKIFLNDQKIF